MITISLWKTVTVDSWSWCIEDIDDIVKLTIGVILALVISPVTLLVDVISSPIQLILLIKYLVKDKRYWRNK